MAGYVVISSTTMPYAMLSFYQYVGLEQLMHWHKRQALGMGSGTVSLLLHAFKEN